MYLKKVEIQGFKSFGNLVQLDVPIGITAVVGPNGCGKSNIADAMRWVLGEQSAKLLRGIKMQDVIFAGTQNRKGLGYAQVSMTIDNTAGKLKIDYSEVVVTRRVYRSGESEYLINKSPCRLKDIHEIFMGTGVGKEGYSIIGQGQIDKILSSKPEDRRNLFEEAAGVYKYKLRKMEAEKKLEQKQENLIRIQDILRELESRLDTLEEQAKKAKKYMDIRQELKDVEVNIFILEADKIETELLELTTTYETLQEDYQQNNHNLKETKTLYDAIREKLILLQDFSTELQTEITNIRMEIEKNEGNIKVHFERINAIDETIKRINDNNEKRNNRSVEQEAEKLLFKTRLSEIQKSNDLDEKQLNQLEAEFEQMEKEAQILDQTSQGYKDHIYHLMSKVADMKANIDKDGTLTQQIEVRKNQIIDLINRRSTDIQQQDIRYQVLEKKQNQAKTHHTRLSKESDVLEKELEELHQEQNQLHTIKRTTEDIYHKSRSKYNVLAQMKNEYEGFYKSVKNILSLKQKNPERWQNIHGVVGEIITVPKELETAVDVAIGNSIQHIVTKDEETANRVIDYIKKHDLGRATFLPLSAIKGYTLGADATSIPKEAGVIGFANTLVGYDPLYSGIIANLLGRVILVDNMTHAIALAKKYKYRYRIVTLEGEVLNPGGSITGGNFHKNKGNLFSRNREVQELKIEIDQHEKKLQNLMSKEQELSHQCDHQLLMLKTKKEEIVTIEKEQVELRIEMNNVGEALKQIKQQKLDLEQEEDEITANSKQMYIDIEGYKSLLKHAQLEVEKLENDIEHIEKTIQSSKREKEVISNKITDLKVSLSSKREILRSTQEQIQRIEKEMLDNYYEDQTDEQQLEKGLSRKQELEGEIEGFQNEIEQSRQSLIKIQAKLEEVNDEKTAYTNKENVKRQEQEQIIERNSLLQTEIYRLENKTTKLNLEKENIFSKIWDEYEITYHGALELKKEMGSITELRKIASVHKGEIRALGVINSGAIEEYAETSERYEFMRGHEQDILSAETTLLRLIEDLTASMETIFKEEFKKISDNFNAVFTELFGGGQAFLELSDDEDVLESGIEIIAQPPGKKLQNMMLLSGGERALTAIAILFGILHLRPSPFAVLDEIEAALDDANVFRFSEYLKKMGKKMQFVVITHRKGTMAVADTIYGVTMEEQGVSKVISVQLDEAQGYTTPNAT